MNKTIKIVIVAIAVALSAIFLLTMTCPGQEEEVDNQAVRSSLKVDVAQRPVTSLREETVHKVSDLPRANENDDLPTTTLVNLNDLNSDSFIVRVCNNGEAPLLAIKGEIVCMTYDSIIERENQTIRAKGLTEQDRIPVNLEGLFLEIGACETQEIAYQSKTNLDQCQLQSWNAKNLEYALW